MTDIDKITEKIAKLLRQAEDVPGTPEEAVFQAKAFELLAKYGIDQAQVEAVRGGLDTSSIPDAIKRSFRIEGKYASAQLLLLDNIAKALHCNTVYTTGYSDGYASKKTMTMFVFGMERHLDRVSILWNMLQPQMMRQVGVVRPLYRDNVKSYRRAWIAGFGSTIGARLREQESKALSSAGGGALVLYRGDKERAALALKEAFPRVRVNTGARYDRSGLADGQAAGRRASFSQAIAS
jgi:hypothetical protein